jgi:hypothetical protein
MAAALAFCLVAVAVPQAARADDAATARELFTQGNTFFDVGQFDKAIDAWQRGYQLKNDPGFLYNIGQAYRTKGDPDKAIFFYKRYLANAPKAKNRAEVEQKIEALQKQVQEKQPPAATTPPPPTSPPPAVEPPATAPAAPVVTPPPVSPPPVVTVPEPAPIAPPPPAPPRTRRGDVGVGLGFDAWSSGLRAHADPSFAFTVQGGYTFGRPAAQVRFRLGALFGYTFLKETSGTDTFVSLLLDPTFIFRMGTRWRLMADLGLGAVSISGMTPTSTLLVVPKDGHALTVKGSGVARAVIRIGVGLEYELAPAFALFFWPAVASSPQSGNFYGQLTRVELLFGAAYRF